MEHTTPRLLLAGKKKSGTRSFAGSILVTGVRANGPCAAVAQKPSRRVNLATCRRGAITEFEAAISMARIF
jgi:hypothetical protein